MSNIYSLKQSESIIIQGIKYKIIAGIEFSQGFYLWKEYTLETETKDIAWLSVERSVGPDRYMLTQDLKDTFSPKDSFMYGRLIYNVFDSGTARVKNKWGKTDVEIGELVEFKEYLYETPKEYTISPEEDVLLTYEKWEDEEEFSKGKYLEEEDIEGENLSFEPAEKTNMEKK